MEAGKRILSRLEDWQEREGPLPEPIGFYRDLLRIQVEAGERIPRTGPRATRTEIAAQIRQGVPLLKWDALSVDWDVFAAVVEESAEAIRDRVNSAAEGLSAMASRREDLQNAARAWFEGQPLDHWTDQSGMEESLLALALHCALKPFLSARAESLIELVPQNQWRARGCPICGGKPDFSYLDKESGARWLVCSRCDSEWLYQRVQCPYCGTQDHESLAYYPDESETYRLYLCKACKTYLKAVDLRRADSEVLMPLERLMTTDLDRQAQEQGFSPGWTPTPAEDT